MKKYILGLASVLVIVGLLASQVSAWTFGMAGRGECQPDGSFLITYTVNNPEKEKLRITDSSDTAVVPVGTKVDKESSADFPQSVDGSVAGSFTLTLKGNFKSDEKIRVRQATVDLKEPCEQPPKDLCPNLEGTQEVVPQGKVLKNGDCVDVVEPIIPVLPPASTPVGGGK